MDVPDGHILSPPVQKCLKTLFSVPCCCSAGNGTFCHLCACLSKSLWCVTLPLCKGKKSQSFLRAVTLTSVSLLRSGCAPVAAVLCPLALPRWGQAAAAASLISLSRSPSLCCFFPSCSSLSVTQVISLPALSSAVFPTMPRKMGSWVLISRCYYKQQGLWSLLPVFLIYSIIVSLYSTSFIV